MSSDRSTISPANTLGGTRFANLRFQRIADSASITSGRRDRWLNYVWIVGSTGNREVGSTLRTTLPLLLISGSEPAGPMNERLDGLLQIFAGALIRKLSFCVELVLSSADHDLR